MKITFLVSDRTHRIHLIQAVVTIPKRDYTDEIAWDWFLENNTEYFLYGTKVNLFTLDLVGVLKGHVNWLEEEEEKREEEESFNRFALEHIY